MPNPFLQMLQSPDFWPGAAPALAQAGDPYAPNPILGALMGGQDSMAYFAAQREEEARQREEEARQREQEELQRQLLLLQTAQAASPESAAAAFGIGDASRHPMLGPLMAKIEEGRRKEEEEEALREGYLGTAAGDSPEIQAILGILNPEQQGRFVLGMKDDELRRQREAEELVREATELQEERAYGLRRADEERAEDLKYRKEIAEHAAGLTRPTTQYQEGQLEDKERARRASIAKTIYGNPMLTSDEARNSALRDAMAFVETGQVGEEGKIDLPVQIEALVMRAPPAKRAALRRQIAEDLKTMTIEEIIRDLHRG